MAPQGADESVVDRVAPREGLRPESVDVLGHVVEVDTVAASTRPPRAFAAAATAAEELENARGLARLKPPEDGDVIVVPAHPLLGESSLSRKLLVRGKVAPSPTRRRTLTAQPMKREEDSSHAAAPPSAEADGRTHDVLQEAHVRLESAERVGSPSIPAYLDAREAASPPSTLGSDDEASHPCR